MTSPVVRLDEYRKRLQTRRPQDVTVAAVAREIEAALRDIALQFDQHVDAFRAKVPADVADGLDESLDASRRVLTDACERMADIKTRYPNCEGRLSEETYQFVLRTLDIARQAITEMERVARS